MKTNLIRLADDNFFNMFYFLKTELEKVSTDKYKVFFVDIFGNKYLFKVICDCFTPDDVNIKLNFILKDFIH